MKDTIITAMREIEHDVNGAKTCIQFVERTSQTKYINIVAREGCCYSLGGKEKNFVKKTTSEATTQGIAYDFDSIMHYGPYLHAKDTSKLTLAPKPGKAVGVEMGQRLYLSDADVTRIQKYYGCPIDTSHITRVTQTGYCIFLSLDWPRQAQSEAAS
ncbi:astacin-like metalloendopeptidase [Aplysia californica]|uniref:Astacin-like metalloendopeptidase n=1 Tax=Aplysia californica TaxID=6500 RepID=A0ABM1W1D9_APLCA|nr:astacin-like metalloendopeptidase [Aplysia californica]